MEAYNQFPSSVNPDECKVYVAPADKPQSVTYSPVNRVILCNGCTEFKQAYKTKGNYRGTRKKITKFSPRSRRNLLKKLFSLSLYPSHFITLTYPNFFPADSSEWKRHLDNFRRRFFDKFPKAWFFWKLEPQKRGAPHYHLIGDLGEEVNIHMLRRLVAWMWFDVCGIGDPKHLLAGTNVEIIKDSKKKMQSYICKYVGKTNETEYKGWEHPGRFWGTLGQDNLPEAIAITFTMNNEEYYMVRRLVRRWLKNISPKCKAYAKRLAKLPSFFVLVPSEVIDRFLDFTLGDCPF